MIMNVLLIHSNLLIHRVIQMTQTTDDCTTYTLRWLNVNDCVCHIRDCDFDLLYLTERRVIPMRID